MVNDLLMERSRCSLLSLAKALGYSKVLSGALGNPFQVTGNRSGGRGVPEG